MDKKKFLRRIFDVHIWAVAIAIIGITTAIAQVTITTYYPAPYGGYNIVKCDNSGTSLGKVEAPYYFSNPSGIGTPSGPQYWLNPKGSAITNYPPSTTNLNEASRLHTLGVVKIFDINDSTKIVDPGTVSKLLGLEVNHLKVVRPVGTHPHGPPFGDCIIDRNLTVNGNLAVLGTSKSAAIDTKFGKRLVFAMESTEVRLTDQGESRLNNGTAKIEIEDIFKDTIENTDNYLVTITPMDNCKGMYVSKRTPDYFIVEELNGGKSSVRFCWEISAIRKGCQGKRLDTFKEPQTEIAEAGR